ncbi:hypothetical protein [Schumannella sp. 10F1B-5-1]|uniref:hypothetical protein n=1 Tax=Schumannella sp. 10F1B-5-1 TaxID=2590780 RepID=UPI00112FFE00|nr:hypothetical protein [Schumannella sp. 10F1B-5-1]TPW78517.1 hypothetical protein FJ658_01625 [Schumannella sp. 10F1B-5-1]
MTELESATARTARRLMIAGIATIGVGYLLNFAVNYLVGALLDVASPATSPLVAFGSVQSLSPVAYAVGGALLGAGIVIRVLRPRVTRFHGSRSD